MTNQIKAITGFTLIELSITLIVMGLLASAALSLYQPGQQLKAQLEMQQELKKTTQSLINYALRHYRLPCPDTDQDGYEDCASSYNTGSIPFFTLGLNNKTAITNTASGVTNMIYGVYRDSAAPDKNLTFSQPSSLSSSINDFITRLNNALLALPTVNFPYVTGDGIYNAENCINNFENMAFVIASAGGEDRSGNGNPFDGINQNLAHNGNGANCFSSPIRPEDANYDDGVIAISFTAMLGYMGS
ncbi:MAG: type II secretion system protein [Pseudomonadota bacterium]